MITATVNLVMGDKPSRRCGDCQLCCKLLPMKADSAARVPEISTEMVLQGYAQPAEFRGMLAEWDKPAGAHCKHQRHRKGCAVYSRRPFGCRYWNCRWLVNDDTADMHRPDRAGYVIDLMPDFITMQPHDGSEPTNIEVIQIWVDPKRPDAWRNDAQLRAYMARRGEDGKAFLVRFNSADGITVFPPAMSEDGTFREVSGQSFGREHSGEEKIAGIAQAKRVKVG
jgi:hypothetical protein